MPGEEFFPEAIAETARVDFKVGFDTGSLREWCEVIKDLVAMANTGGGIILFGLNDDGTPSSANLSALMRLDPATVTDKLARYVGQQFSGFRVSTGIRSGAPVVALEIEAAGVPLVFTAPGTYEVPNPSGKQQQKTAFSQGTIYFRHGAKSEPATRDDLRAVVEREVERQRSAWLDNIKKVISAPAGSVISVLPPTVTGDASQRAPQVRLTHDAAAPALQAPDFDSLYPYRQKEVLARLAQLLPGVRLTGHDLLCVRRQYGLDEDPTYSSKHKFGSRQYSEAMVDWLVTRYRADANFFNAAKEAWKRSSEAAVVGQATETRGP
jgi:hypothetical protein